MKDKILNIPEVGHIILMRSLRAKKLRITLKPFQPVKVTVPKAISYLQAESFVFRQLNWILKHQHNIKKLEQKRTIFDEQTDFQTRHHQLRIVRKELGKLEARTVNGLILVSCPCSIDITSDEAQQTIRQGIERAWRKEAKLFLPNRLDTLAKSYGFSYTKLFIKNTKTRWGSCSAQNNINISLHVMRLPDSLLDYVFLHELSHTIEKNHSHRFWKLLRSVCNDAKGLDLELKRHDIAIY